MNQVSANFHAQISTNGSWSGNRRVRRAHHGPNDLPSVSWSLNHHGHYWTTRDEGHEALVKGLAEVLGVMPFGRSAVESTQFGRHELQSPSFETTNNLPDETAFDAVGLDQDQSSFHDEAIYQSQI